MTDSRNIPESERVFIVGTSEAGKSYRAWMMYLARMKRRIIVDNTGEWSARADAAAFTVPEAVDAIRSLARSRSEWTVTVSLDDSDMPELVTWLIPLPHLDRSPVRALGGAALFVDEVDLVAPPRSMREETRTLYRRSRHVGLTLISATQRPANVSREVSAMSTQALMLSLSENADVAYMKEMLSLSPQQVEQWRRWTHQHHHGGIHWNRRTGRLMLVPDSGPMRPFRNPQSDAFDAVPEQSLPVPVPVPE